MTAFRGYPSMRARDEALEDRRVKCEHDYVRLVGGYGWHRCRRCGKNTRKPTR